METILKLSAPNSPCIYLEDANPDVFFDIPIRCNVSGCAPGEIYVAVTVSQTPVCSQLKPCGWHNVLMYQKNGGYEQKFFDLSEKIIVSKGGFCNFGIKFLPLSKDGLLPQGPVRVSLARDPQIEDIIVSSDQFRVIAHKVLVNQLPEPGCMLPRFEIALGASNNTRTAVSAKLDVSMFSTSSPTGTLTPLVSWVRETQVSWNFDCGSRIIDHVNLPATITFNSLPNSNGKTAFRVCVAILNVTNSTVSLTKIGRGFSSYFSLRQPAAFQVENRDLIPPQGTTVTVSAARASSIEHNLLLDMNRSLAAAASTETEATPVEVSLAVEAPPTSPSAPAPTSQSVASSTTQPNDPSTEQLPEQSMEQSAAQLSELPTRAALLSAAPGQEFLPGPIGHTPIAQRGKPDLAEFPALRNIAPLSYDALLVPAIKSPHDIFRQFSQAVMKALNGAFNANDPFHFSKEALNEAFSLYEKLDMNVCFSRLQNPTMSVEKEAPSNPVSYTSLKQFSLPGAVTNAAFNSSQCNNDSSVTLVSRAESSPIGLAMKLANAHSAPPSRDIIGSAIESYSTREQSDPEQEVLYVNTNYVSNNSNILGFPAHRGGDFKLVGFYEENPGGVQFIVKKTHPGIEDFLQSFCAQDHDNASFFVKKMSTVSRLAADVVQLLPNRQYYNFP